MKTKLNSNQNGQLAQSPEPNNVEKFHWDSAGSKDNKNVLMGATISINGIPYTTYGIRVFDPEMTEICASGSVTLRHLDAYGSILWNVEHGRQFIHECFKSDFDKEKIPDLPAYLQTAKFKQLDDWLEKIIMSYKSDSSLTPPRIVLGGHPYILTILPASENTEAQREITINNKSWLPYSSEPGYKEALIEIDDHLIKIKAFEVFETREIPFKTTQYSTGNEIISYYLEQNRAVADMRNAFTDCNAQSLPSAQIEGHNYLLFGMSAVKLEEQKRYRKYLEEQEVANLLPQGIVEYRLNGQIPEDWANIIEFMAAEVSANRSLDHNDTFTLDLAQLDKIDIEIPENILAWLNATTRGVLYRAARWYTKNNENQLETNPEEFNFSFEWVLRGRFYRTQLTPTSKKLLENMEQGAAQRASNTSDPLRIVI